MINREIALREYPGDFTEHIDPSDPEMHHSLVRKSMRTPKNELLFGTIRARCFWKRVSETNLAERENIQAFDPEVLACR